MSDSIIPVSHILGVIAHDMFVEPVSAVKGGEPEPVMIIDERHYACNLFPSC